MSIWNVIYSFICGAMMMMSVLGLESAVDTPSLSRWDKHFFTSYFSVLVLGSLTFFLEVIGYMIPGFETLQNAAWYFQSLLYIIPFPMLATYLLHCCGEDWRHSALFRIVMALFVVYFIVLNIAQFTVPAFYYTSPDNELHLGPAYPLLIAPVLGMLAFTTAGVIRRQNKLSPQYRRGFLICLLPLSVAVLIHMFIPVYILIDVTLTLSAYSMYRIIVSESIEQNLRQQQQIAAQDASIAVLQMRPHFIYNTMTSIYYLCDQDPQLAKQVTMDFTTYLRKNFTAVASAELIPFSEELEHTRAYLAVEQAQFEDGLLVDYDTPHTQFRMPPLTLQPIVENAVKHGMDPDSGPLHIWIQTSETFLGSEIVVKDNGPGFDSAIADDPHTTLANIRLRLEMMCNGKLDIASREEDGTTVTITIPTQS